jgi:hypothetical protein
MGIFLISNALRLIAAGMKLHNDRLDPDRSPARVARWLRLVSLTR